MNTGISITADPRRISLAHEAELRLGPLTIQPALRRVVHDDGREDFLEPRVMQLFVALLRADGRLLSRDDLLHCCWDGRIVGDDAINRTLSRLRRVAASLGDEVFTVETIPRVGYRLVRIDTPANSSEDGQGRGLDRRALMIGGAVLLTAGGGGAWYFVRQAAGFTDSIAVLPFANLSGDPAQAYFGDGIAEELRSALSRLPGLKVAGRISSEAVRHEDAVAAARQLSVSTILTGSVRRAQGMVRITSQLINGYSGLEQWSESYDRPDGNVLAIQTDIARNVVAALIPTLSPESARALSVGGTNNAAAHDLYLRALNQVQSDDSESSLQQADALLDAALATDPRFAQALAMKARNLSYLADLGHSPSQISAGYASAVSAARGALAIAPTLPAGYAALADALYGQRKIAASAKNIETGLRFAPNDLQLLQAAVITLVAAGRAAEALRHADRMVELDPLNPLPHRRRYYALYYGGRYAECIAEAQRTQKLAPTLAMPAYFIALSLIMKGRLELAQHYLETMSPELTVRLAGEAIVAARLGDRAKSDRKLDQLRSVYGDAASYQFAQAYAQRGEADRAIAALQRGIEVNDPGLNTLKVDPLFAPLRGDPRFVRIMSQVDLTKLS